MIVQWTSGDEAGEDGKYANAEKSQRNGDGIVASPYSCNKDRNPIERNDNTSAILPL